MDSFIEGIQTKVKGIGDLYEVGEVYVKEDNKTRECTIYTLGNGKKINNTTLEVFLKNIKNLSQTISYDIVSLSDGCFERINKQANECNLYEIAKLFYAVSGEELSRYDLITSNKIYEIINLYRTQRQYMKYTKLERAICKGKEIYIGEYYQKGISKKVELFGNVSSNSNQVISERKTLADNSQLKFFKNQDNTLKFTERALKSIADRYKEVMR